MKILFATVVLLFGCCLTANADVWKWVDAAGKTYFVETMKPIYTWVDEDGRFHYSDSPDHEDAVLVVLVWHSKGRLTDLGENKVDEISDGLADETDEERADREAAEAHNCKRATEIFESYVNAPRLYRTGEDGDREYLSKKEKAATIAETKAKMTDLCRR